MKLNNITFNDIADIFESGYYDVTQFVYDSHSKYALYEYNKFDVKFEALKLKRHARIEFNWILFKEVVYYYAKMNTQNEIEILIEIINKWLTGNNKTKTSVIEIKNTLFEDNMTHITVRSLDMRIAKCLKELGWSKKKTTNNNIWLKDG